MRTLRGHQEAAAGTAVLMLAVVLTAPLHYGFGLALTWLLPAADFGVVSVLLTVLLLATTVLAAGFPWALARTVARAEDGDPEAAAEVDAAFRSALVGNVGLGTALALGFAGVQLTTGAILPGVGAGVTLLAAGTIVLVALGQVLLGGLQGARRFAAVSGARVVEVLVKVVVGVGAVALIGTGAVGVGWGLLLGAAVAALWAWWTMRDRLPRLAWRARRMALLRRRRADGRRHHRLRPHRHARRPAARSARDTRTASRSPPSAPTRPPRSWPRRRSWSAAPCPTPSSRSSPGPAAPRRPTAGSSPRCAGCPWPSSPSCSSSSSPPTRWSAASSPSSTPRPAVSPA